MQQASLYYSMIGTFLAFRARDRNVILKTFSRMCTYSTYVHHIDSQFPPLGDGEKVRYLFSRTNFPYLWEICVCIVRNKKNSCVAGLSWPFLYSLSSISIASCQAGPAAGGPVSAWKGKGGFLKRSSPPCPRACSILAAEDLYIV